MQDIRCQSKTSRIEGSMALALLIHDILCRIGGGFEPLPKPTSRIAKHIKGREEVMDEGTFQRKLGELVAEIGTLPESEREKLTTMAEETLQRHQELKKTVNNLQESIDFLRLSIKYLLFDLEATRRENSYLRKMLEEGTGS
jgi:hypothetical protein